MNRKSKMLKFTEIILLILTIIILIFYLYNCYLKDLSNSTNKFDNNIYVKEEKVEEDLNKNNFIEDNNTIDSTIDETSKEIVKEHKQEETSRKDKNTSTKEETKLNDTKNDNVIKENNNQNKEDQKKEEQQEETTKEETNNEENNKKEENKDNNNENTFNQEEYEKLKKDTYPTYEDCANKGIQLSIADETNSIVGSYCETLAYQGKLVGYKLYLRYESGELIRYIEQS